MRKIRKNHFASKSDLNISKIKEKFDFYKSNWDKQIKKRKLFDKYGNSHNSKMISLI
jgi:hypothetical protein